MATKFALVGSGMRLRLAAVLALSATVVWSPMPAAGSSFSSAFVVADLPVDATGKSGVAARDAARDAGEKQALQLLLQRLTAPQDWPRLPVLSGEDVTDLVLDFEVESEHVSASHYLGRYTFRFDPKGIRNLLQLANIPFTELVSKSVVVVPVYQNSNETHLWDDPNPWRDAWNKAHGPAGLVPWIVPVGDLSDVQSVDVPDVQHPVPDKLAGLSQRYGGGDVAVVSATEQDTPPPAGSHPGTNPAATLQITVTRYGAAGADSETTSVTGGKPDAGFYLSGVLAGERLLEDLWKKLSLPGEAPQGAAGATATTGPGGFGYLAVPGNKQEIDVLVPVAALGDWIKMRDKIGQVSGVLGTRIEVLTKDSVLVRLTLSQEPETLALAFAQQDLALVPGAKGGPMLLQQASNTVPSASVPQTPPAPQTPLAPLPAQTLQAAPGAPAAAGQPPVGSPGPGGAVPSIP